MLQKNLVRDLALWN